MNTLCALKIKSIGLGCKVVSSLVYIVFVLMIILPIFLSAVENEVLKSPTIIIKWTKLNLMGLSIKLVAVLLFNFWFPLAFSFNCLLQLLTK